MDRHLPRRLLVLMLVAREDRRAVRTVPPTGGLHVLEGEVLARRGPPAPEHVPPPLAFVAELGPGLGVFQPPLRLVVGERPGGIALGREDEGGAEPAGLLLPPREEGTGGGIHRD